MGKRGFCRLELEKELVFGCAVKAIIQSESTEQEESVAKENRSKGDTMYFSFQVAHKLIISHTQKEKQQMGKIQHKLH